MVPWESKILADPDFQNANWTAEWGSRGGSAWRWQLKLTLYNQARGDRVGWGVRGGVGGGWGGWGGGVYHYAAPYPVSDRTKEM